MGLLCLAWPVWPGSLNGWSWHAGTAHHILASLERAHHSSLPALPSASGRPGLGAVGGDNFLHGGLQLESNKDVGVFGSPASRR